MDNLLNHISESISGIWGNKEYEIVLGLNNTFFFEEKESGKIINGTYSIIQLPQNRYATLRLTELNGTTHDYDIIDVIIFHTLIISHEGEKIHLENVPPDEYEGEIFNPADN
jgi:hypothetical protein